MSKDEQLLHLDLAEDKLSAARDLFADEHFTDAVGRAYYAMFHAAMALVRSKGHTPRTHRGLLHILGREFVGPSLLSNDEILLFRAEQQAREAGDYETGFTMEENEAREAIDQAEAFVRHIESIVR